MGFRFGTKAETLERLAGHVTRFVVPQLRYFTVAAWRADREAVLRDVSAFFERSPEVVVRSSALVEDGAASSMAGAFESSLHVDPRDPEALAAAVEATIASYRGHPGDQVLVQDMVRDVEASGVIMTRSIQDGSPYYIVNYDDESGRTDSITGGVGESKTVLVHRNVDNAHFDSLRLVKMVNLAREVEHLTGPVPLDIEFAIGRDGAVRLLQVRRICLTGSWQPDIEQRVNRRIPHVERFVAERSAPRPGLAGGRTILSNMADWNPAEMIGSFPRPLAASLYREIITRSAWRLARRRMGYRPLPAEELMVLVAGRPFIDVRASFNSFLPPGLPPELEERLVEAWLDRLDARPELHDKVEFEVAFTVLGLDFEETLARRYPGLLSPDEAQAYGEGLFRLTRGCLDLSPAGSLRTCLAEVEVLAARQADRLGPDQAPRRPLSLAAGMASLLEECRTLGAIPFSVAARHAFIAETLLRSASARGVLAPERVLSFKRSTPTVMGELAAGLRAACRGEPDRSRFLRRYGHLRPGTYDILSPRYDRREDLFEGCLPPEDFAALEPFALTGPERRDLDGLLRASGLGPDAEGLLEYARLAIRGREYAKFVFTRNLSDALELAARLGETLGLGRDDLSWLPVSQLLDLPFAAVPDDLGRRLLEASEAARAEAEAMEGVKLSYLIRSVRDIYVAPQHRSAPNFITSRRVAGPIATLTSRSCSQVDLFDRIVCIENADPGFDWIFTRGIKGLVTKYGGANSHMAIRSAEFGLAAAIGCGEHAFERILAAGAVELNCAEKTLRPIHG